MTKQVQRGGDASTNIQAQGNVYLGVSYDQARQIALDVFEANFLRLSGLAEQVALERASFITEKFLSKFALEYPQGIAQVQDPDFQFALFSAQKEFARSGDEGLGDLLVQLLIDRTKQPDRGMQRTVLNESLLVAPKLTDDQISALSIILVIRYAREKTVRNLGSLLDFLNKNLPIDVISNGLLEKQISLQHMEYAGCGSLSSSFVHPVAECLMSTYPGIFKLGFTESEVAIQGLDFERLSPILCPSDFEVGRFRIDVVLPSELNLLLASSGLEEYRREILFLYRNTTVKDLEVRSLLRTRSTVIDIICDKWERQLGMFSLTSVGMAIGHANLKKEICDLPDFFHWTD